jgi:tRNA(adenine34) deaminase
MSGRVPQIFGPVPEVVSGVLAHEAELAWLDWNPLAWYLVKRRRLLGDARADEAGVHAQMGRDCSLWHHLQMMLERIGKSQALALLNGSTEDL